MDLTNMNEEILFEEYEKKFRKMAYELTSKRVSDFLSTNLLD